VTLWTNLEDQGIGIYILKSNMIPARVPYMYLEYQLVDYTFKTRTTDYTLYDRNAMNWSTSPVTSPSVEAFDG
jgi:hypothetical protein